MLLIGIIIAISLCLVYLYMNSAPVERSDHRCGPQFENAKCGPYRCCSTSGWCGSPGEDHCKKSMNDSRYNGPNAIVSD